MFRRFTVIVLLSVMVAFAAGCRKNKSVNPIANLDSKQPDKVLFDRAMDALKRNKFDVARITLQTLINTYPDSEYVARAMLSVGDAWYTEGGTASYQQAEAEYKNFQTFFPNMPEAAEAQLKVAYIHYKQMEKPDRDYTHAKRADDEYRQLIEMYPDSKLVPEAKQRLLEVQEVLGEREYRIGRFYFLRESFPAAIARLKTLADTYPLYSQTDEALLMLGGSHEAQAELVRASGLSETQKADLVRKLTDKAVDAYTRIVTRYPATPTADEAKQRLQALSRPVPTPTPEMMAQNKAEEESRGKTGRMGQLMGNLRRRPDMATAVKVGEPTMAEPPQTSAPAIVRQINEDFAAAATNTVTVEKGTAGELKSDPIPRSTPPAAGEAGAPNGEQPAPPPAQINEAAGEQAGATQAQPPAKQQSSSKKKKKSGLRKIIPF